jgi:hypothetical protein
MDNRNLMVLVTNSAPRRITRSADYAVENSLHAGPTRLIFYDDLSAFASSAGAPARRRGTMRVAVAGTAILAV